MMGDNTIKIEIKDLKKWLRKLKDNEDYVSDYSKGNMVSEVIKDIEGYLENNEDY